MRKAMRAVGADIRKAARRKVARRAISTAGQAPGKDTGVLQRSIKYRVSRPGLLVVIRPEKTEAMGKDFYPAYLNYGVRRNGRSSGPDQGERGAGFYKLAPRLNYMEETLDERREYARQVLSTALTDALTVRRS